MREYAAKRGWIIAMQIKEVGSGASQRELRETLLAAGRAMAGLLAVFAEFEREILRERVRAGLDHARQNGKRPAMEARKLYRQGISKSEIARQLSISQSNLRPPPPGPKEILIPDLRRLPGRTLLELRFRLNLFGGQQDRWLALSAANSSR